ncbi:YdcH family protein [Notoacmeibacter sp. MSK16QG-6]|uniref:YdcH family protein n=1 Tax=Notoacmeibacter sp. MSK16QG-6 TaxID=2957982 RepID=UPI00353096FC
MWPPCASIIETNGGMLMSLESHLAQLQRKHGDLDQQIESLQVAPAKDDLEIARLKRKKLALKDEIMRLSPPVHH